MGPIFPRTIDRYIKTGAAVALLAIAGTVLLYSYFAHPDVREVGYRPTQPVAYSHKLHAGNLGMDCTYCHYTVDKSSYAAVPAAEICMNCHVRIRPQSVLLAPIRESYATGAPVEWIRVHSLPDYVYFNHQAHVTAGVSCLHCHGRVDQMDVVHQVEPLSMAWCLDCHRSPAGKVRPAELVTQLDWVPDRNPEEIGRQIIAEKRIAPPVNCAGCHR
jgi:menaquinone reductase, multiheme cytochrome c subunit